MAAPPKGSPSDEKCPKICKEIGAFVESPEDPDRINDELKYAAKNAQYAQSPASDQEPLGPLPSGEVYLPGLRPGLDGQINWTPLADMTGTRPSVNKYTLSRYSLKEWTKHNLDVLESEAINESNIIDYNAKTSMMQGFGNVDKTQSENYKKLRQRAREVFRWKVEVERACKAITDEVEKLEIERQRLKGATRSLMLPESISKECLDLRSNRAAPDLVSDAANVELIKEMNLVSEVRDNLKVTLQKIEDQQLINKSAKARIEYDYCDKEMAYNTETMNMSLNTKSKLIMWKPGSTRFGENSAPLEYWDYFSRDNVQNCEEVRQNSIDLRGTLNAILVQGGRKLRNQADKTDMALAETVAITTALCTKLEELLRSTLQKIADMETIVDNLQQSVQKLDGAMKLAQTRLENRNIWRPHGENVRDSPHLGLLEEARKIHETVTSLIGQIRNAERVRADLCKKRIQLEQDIASKRKTLNIDRERCGMIRSHYPSASELAGF